MNKGNSFNAVLVCGGATALAVLGLVTSEARQAALALHYVALAAALIGFVGSFVLFPLKR